MPRTSMNTSGLLPIDGVWPTYLLECRNIYSCVCEVRGPSSVRRASVSGIVFPAKGFVPYLVPHKTFGLFGATRDVHGIEINLDRSLVGRDRWPTVSGLKSRIPRSYSFQTLCYSWSRRRPLPSYRVVPGAFSA